MHSSAFRMTPSLTGFLGTSLCLLFIAGCPPKPAGNGNTANGTATSGHAHSHDEGPEGGHLIELGDEAYHVEWLHDDEEGVLTFIIRDGDAKEEVPIAADHLVIRMITEDEQGVEHEMDAEVPSVGRSEETPKSARFVLADPKVTHNVAAEEKVTAFLKVTIDGVPYEEQIEHAAGHGHSHGH